MPNSTESADQDEANFNLFANAGLNNEVAKALRAISRVADANATKAYLVGGMVREIVSSRAKITTSPDITVIGEAATFASALTANIPDCELIATSQHHTAKVKIDNVSIDIASARTDAYDPLGSLPQITLVDDIELDLGRRDFTVNAMAIPLNHDGHGTLIDPFNGRHDTRNGVFRVIKPESFHEDPLRMMRGIRLAARYGYRFDHRTQSLISEALDDLRLMTEHSPQRVFNEFKLWFAAQENLDEIVKLASCHDLLKSLGINTNFTSSSFNRIPADEPDITRFSAFAYFLPPETSSSLTKRLVMPSDWTEISKDAAKARSIAQRCRHDQITDVELYRALINLQPNVIRSIINVEHNNPTGTRFQDFQTRLRHIKPHLNGDDLIAVGVKQGPMIGNLLDELLTLRIKGKVSTVEEERQHILNRLNDD